MTAETNEIKKQVVLAHFIGQKSFNRTDWWYNQIYSIVARDKNVECGLCLRKIEKISQVTIDHIVPRSKGGDNSLSNKQLAHLSCNGLKGSDSFRPPNYYRAHTQENGERIGKVILRSKLAAWEEDIKKATKAKEPLKEIAKPKKPSPKIELTLQSSNWATDLWNEIARNQFKNLSYTKFEQYFKNYSQQQA